MTSAAKLEQCPEDAGIEGERSGLWSEYARIIGELRPRYVIVENVAALLNRGLERVLGDLAALGYDAEWHCIPASAVGGYQRRDRVWIIAYPTRSCSETLLHKNSLHVEGNFAWMDGQRGRSPNIDNQDRRASALSLLEDSFWPEIPNRERSGTNGRLSDGVDRYRAIGNSLVPQIAEIIGRAIMAIENAAH